jgi:hypothetical protein
MLLIGYEREVVVIRIGGLANCCVDDEEGVWMNEGFTTYLYVFRKSSGT